MTCVVRRTKRDKHCSPDHQKTITTITHVTLSWKQRTSRFFTKLSTTHVILEATHVTLFDSDLLRVSQDSRSRTWSAPVDVKGEGDTMFSAWDCTCASFSDIAYSGLRRRELEGRRDRDSREHGNALPQTIHLFSRTQYPGE
jgi:hypothetical protein